MDNKETEKWILNQDYNFRYQLLGRFVLDCEYFLGFGFGNEGKLWALKVEDQIYFMKAIYNSFGADEKPEWLTFEQIENYENEMLKAERTRNQYYIIRGSDDCIKTFFSYGIEKIKDKKEIFEKELKESYDPYNQRDQFKEGYVAEAQRIIGVEND